MRRRRLLVVLIVLAVLAVATGFQTSPAGAADSWTWGSFALSGQEAREFRVPSDVVAVRSWSDSSGRSVTRYQQMVDGASVYGGQITVTRDASGTIVAAIGAYFPGLQPKNTAAISRARRGPSSNGRSAGAGSGARPCGSTRRPHRCSTRCRACVSTAAQCGGSTAPAEPSARPSMP
jgi:Fungalysin/Thermolysin Propeptide Motif